MADLFDNPMGTDGFEFVEYTAPDPELLRTLFERMGFPVVARHRSKNVTLHRQGDVNFIINAEPGGFGQRFAQQHGPSACGLAFRVKDAHHAYQRALDQLHTAGATYPCACSRKDIQTYWLSRGQQAPRHAEWVYPGTCRDGLHGLPARAVRLRCGTPEHPVVVHWTDRRLGAQVQNITTEVGDIVLKRADGLWAYQLAVVVDDSAQGITHIVRGEDLADNTPRQIHLQRQLGLSTPLYLHTPLVLDATGEKLSKSSDAPALKPGLEAVQQALKVLGLPVEPPVLSELLAAAVGTWSVVCWKSP